ncbi:MAG: hypothetical protein ACREPU_05185 [Rhodanobacteraceae bacterium]
MTDEQEFFKEGDTSLGTFYPTHYIVAGYHNLADAEAAAMACKKNGFTDDNVRALEGDFVTQQMEAREGANWMERMEQRLAKAAGTETAYVREDADLAHSGGAFLFVYAPDDEHVAKARRVFAQHGPAYARRYLNVAIEIIVKNPNAL